jgi:hypothetical protein
MLPNIAVLMYAVGSEKKRKKRAPPKKRDTFSSKATAPYMYMGKYKRRKTRSVMGIEASGTKIVAFRKSVNLYNFCI